MDKTKIDWCDSTWNPVTGCYHDCQYCYARKIAERFGGKRKYANIYELDEPVRGDDGKIKPYPYSFSPTFHKYKLDEYIGKKGRNIFVCSMADLFGDWVPDSWIEEVFAVCEKAPQHNYLFLTKNPKRYFLLEQKGILQKRENMWYGASITNNKQTEESAPMFCCLQSGTKNFFSIEPILENIQKFKLWDSKYKCQYIDWAIIGAETGRRKDRIIPKRKWIEDIANECRKADVPVFMKSSLVDIWREPLIQEFPKELCRKE